MPTNLLRAAMLLVVTAAQVVAQPAGAVLPVRQLPIPAATSVEVFASLAGLRALSDGRVLVNDHTAHRVVLLDDKLSVASVVADSTSQTHNAYGSRPGGLSAFRGDSSLFVDPASLSILVIDPTGKIARIMAVPRSSEAQYMTGGARGTLAFDERGALLYRGFVRSAPQTPGYFINPDSALVVRLDFASKKLDTISFFRIPKSGTTIVRDENGRVASTSVIYPMFPLVDDWTVMTDRTIAIVRGQDYHVQFVARDGSVTNTPRIPYNWIPIPDRVKQIYVDTTRAMVERQRAQSTSPTPYQFLYPAASELPDYRPVFGTGGVLSDPRNRIWVRTLAYNPGGPIYDVIDRTAKLVDRVQIPTNATIAGFGPNGVIYLGVRENNQLRLAKAVSP